MSRGQQDVYVMKVEPISQAVGARITGVDLSQEMDDATFEASNVASSISCDRSTPVIRAPTACEIGSTFITYTSC